MDDDVRDDVVSENDDTSVDDVSVEDNDEIREEETTDEIRDNIYVNDDEIEMLKGIETRLNTFEEKLDNIISMIVDSGAIIQDSVDDISEQERQNYRDDFIDIDDLDLAL